MELDLAAIRAYCEAATEGPWRAGYEDGSALNEVMTVAEHRRGTKVGVRVESGETKRGRFVSFTRDDKVPPLTFPPMPDALCEIVNEDLPEAERLGNAEFIARAREDLPAVVEALEEAQGKLKRVETEMCTCNRGLVGMCIAHDKNSLLARILKEEK